MNAKITGVLQIAISVQDMARATAFYRDVLGLTLIMGAPSMAFFDCGGVRLYLASGEGAAAGAGNSSIYFRTHDIDALQASLKAKSATIHQPPQIIAKMPDHDLWLMWVKDTEGNLLGAMEERKRQEAQGS
ncbi:MAG TPA: VOC family protein [Steroidobacteraceae bacterium]|jgi:predicted enzyme related to lactoylglutathione lyase|nr:VOC family protein [Steroidobacteraceae bacterium]